MALHTYGVLKGRILDRRHARGGRSRHYQIEVKEKIQHCRVSVNVCSQEFPSELEAAIIEPFCHPLTNMLAGLPLGFTNAPKKPGGLALDYIRSNPVQPEDFQVMPANQPGPVNDLNERLDQLVARCQGRPGAFLYAFGEPWGPIPGQYDEVFHFAPAAGLHNVHMNQGNGALFSHDDHVWQDGGLIFQFGDGPADWAAVFLKFQSQSWHTHDSSGHRLPEPPSRPYRSHGRESAQPRGVQWSALRIHSAVVNGPGQPEQESVTLENLGKKALKLKGYALSDWDKNVMPLPDGLVIEKGARLTIPLRAPVSLSNRGGTITLLDERAWKIHGVAYTRDLAREEGGIIYFNGGEPSGVPGD